MNNIKTNRFARTIKSFLCTALTVILICSSVLFSGCSGENFYLYFAVDTMPYNIDPQKAQDYGELLAVKNCFRGLTKLDKDGNTVLDLAKDYKVSDDGLTYTFALKDATWRDGTTVTSDDFLFALTRATDPITAAPFAKLLECISGASERLSGNADAALGVSAPDPQTVVFTLSKPDVTFLSTLTRSVFMPCNREFFESCGGKYGLDRKHILTNGTYYVAQWLDDRHLKLTLSEGSDHKYHIPENVFLTVSAKDKTNVQRIIDREVGMTVDDMNDYSSIDRSKYTVTTSYLKSYCIVINRNTDFGSNQIMTSAFAQSINHGLYTINMSERFKNAKTILPEDCTVFAKTLNTSSLPEYTHQFDAEKSRSDFLNALKQLPNKKLPDIQVLTLNDPEIRSVLTNIVAQWQSNLGAYVNIKTMSTEKELNEAVTQGNFTIALLPLSGNACDILSKFSDQTSALYLNEPNYDQAIEKLQFANDNATAESAVNTALSILSEDSCVIPIIHTPTAFIYNIEYNDVYFSPFDNTVDFSIIYKK